MLKQDFIANCIERVLAAPCDPACVRQRALDLAQAVRIAADEDERAAHEYLVKLCDLAEAGHYSNVESVR